MWTCGDVFKTAYFVLRAAPTQFWLCGTLQVMIDIAIMLQVFYYAASRAAVHHRRASNSNFANVLAASWLLTYNILPRLLILVKLYATFFIIFALFHCLQLLILCCWLNTSNVILSVKISCRFLFILRTEYKLKCYYLNGMMTHRAVARGVHRCMPPRRHPKIFCWSIDWQ